MYVESYGIQNLDRMIQVSGNSGNRQAAYTTRKSVTKLMMSLITLKASAAQSSFHCCSVLFVNVPQSFTAPQISIPVYGKSLASCTEIIEQTPRAWARVSSGNKSSASKRLLSRSRAHAGAGKLETLEALRSDFGGQLTGFQLGQAIFQHVLERVKLQDPFLSPQFPKFQKAKDG